MQNFLKYAVYGLSILALLLHTVGLMGNNPDVFLGAFIAELALFLLVIVAIIHYNVFEKEDSENP